VVFLHRAEQSVHGAGGQAGRARQFADPQFGFAAVEAAQDCDRTINRLNAVASSHFVGIFSGIHVAPP
jgi:hypothetical protein